MSRRNRAKIKGRRAGSSYVGIPHYVLESKEWGALPGNAVKLLMELAKQYKGNNNGNLSATLRTLRTRGWNSEPTLWKHLGVLERAGWIIKTRQGGRHIGCNLFAISWWPIDECDGVHDCAAETRPSNAWKNANGPSEIEVRNPQKLKSDGVGLQKVKREPVPLRPVA